MGGEPQTSRRTRKEESSPDAERQVVLLKRVALLLAAVAPDRAHVQHAVAELDEGAALDWDVDV